MIQRSCFFFLFAVIVFALPNGTSVAEEKNTKNVLFIGNSYTFRHHLTDVVKAMAEAGNPGLTLNVTTVIYGGRRLVDHWRLGTANYVRLHELTVEEENATIASLEKMLATNPKDQHAKNALGKHQQLIKTIGQTQPQKWDVVVLQSYRDDLEGSNSLFMQFAPKFAELAKDQGANVILYETSPDTQNAEPLTSPPTSEPVLEKAKTIAALANDLDARVGPMSLIGLHCQTQRPDFTLRFVNDGHLNQTFAYLTACAIYTALFDKSPVGLPVDSVTDNRWHKSTVKEKDRDGKPITRVFSETDRADLQRIAWEGIQQFRELRKQ